MNVESYLARKLLLRNPYSSCRMSLCDVLRREVSYITPALTSWDNLAHISGISTLAVSYRENDCSAAEGSVCILAWRSIG